MSEKKAKITEMSEQEAKLSGSEILPKKKKKIILSSSLLLVRPSVKLDAATILRNYINKYRKLMNSKSNRL